MIGRAVRRSPREVAARISGTGPTFPVSRGVVATAMATSPTASLGGAERRGLTFRTNNAPSEAWEALWMGRPPAVATARRRRPRAEGGPTYMYYHDGIESVTTRRRFWSSWSSSSSSQRPAAAAALAVASASAASCLCCLAATTTKTSPMRDDGRSVRAGGRRRRRPVTFGTSVGAYHSTPTGTTGDTAGTPPSSKGSGSGSASDEGGGDGIPSKAEEREYCPICVKYGRGPCGDAFNSWLECTDLHPGKDPETGEDLHLVKCDHLATRLADCLREHAEFYDTDDIDLSEGAGEEEGGEGGDGGADLRSAWENLVTDLERERRDEADEPFPPHLRPDLEVRFAGGGGGSDGGGGTGVATFHPYSDPGRVIVLAYVRDQNGTLLAAGTREDMAMDGGGGGRGGDGDDGEGQDECCALRFVVTETTESVTACALYDDDGEAPSSRSVASSSKKRPVLYKRTALLPPR